MGEYDEPVLLNDAVRGAERAFRRIASALEVYRVEDESGRWANASAMQRDLRLSDVRGPRGEFSVAAERLLGALERAAITRGGERAQFLGDALERYRGLFDLTRFEAQPADREGGLLARVLADVRPVVVGFLEGLETLVVLHGGRTSPTSPESAEPPVVWHGSGAAFGVVMRFVYDRFVAEQNEQGPLPPGTGRTTYVQLLQRLAPLFVKADGRLLPDPESMRTQASNPSGANAELVKQLKVKVDEAERGRQGGGGT